ncbi:hypothetical protein GOBAR_AA34497 [Gossypium barbadense]|uniref:Uncharacterized protein n=1 Tax=Gossypium barbadense TaxID=3634 RepID=A0A2P5W550_GOSBA|nr:hypothetical protein GOBAR_AA34497 [Gossypium barbadense]
MPVNTHSQANRTASAAKISAPMEAQSHSIIVRQTAVTFGVPKASGLLMALALGAGMALTWQSFWNCSCGAEVPRKP